MPRRRTLAATLVVALTLAVAGGALQASHAAGGGGESPARQDWSFNGPFGTFDRSALQRGLQVYREVCSACHSVKRIAFRNLSALGYSGEQIKSLASQYQVVDGPNDEGDLFERPALPSDRIPGPFPNDAFARAANGGALPPDLSLMVKARADGADYIHALLTGYREPPHGVEILEGLYYNPYFSSGQIAMAPPLFDELVEFADGSPSTVEQMSADVSHFLAWVAEPELEQRKRIGLKVLLFLAAFAGVMFFATRRVWSDVR